MYNSFMCCTFENERCVVLSFCKCNFKAGEHSTTPIGVPGSQCCTSLDQVRVGMWCQMNCCEQKRAFARTNLPGRTSLLLSTAQMPSEVMLYRFHKIAPKDSKSFWLGASQIFSQSNRFLSTHPAFRRSYKLHVCFCDASALQFCTNIHRNRASAQIYIIRREFFPHSS